MIRTDAFAKDICAVLNRHPVLKFTPEHPQKGIYGCVDVVGKKGKETRVLIEIELRRYGPERNVLKIWKRLLKQQCEPDIIFFQAFSGFYTRKARAREYAEFIGDKMMLEFKNVRYVPLSFLYKPASRKAGTPVMKGAGRRRYHAKQLAETILSHLEKLTQQRAASFGQ
jgi:hypothetical protein